MMLTPEILFGLAIAILAGVYLVAIITAIEMFRNPKKDEENDQ